MNNKNNEGLDLTPIGDLISEDFGEPGSKERIQFETDCDAFILGEQLKALRQKEGITQEKLAEITGTKTYVISKIENGKSNFPLTTIFKLFRGVGHPISLNFA